MMVIDQSGSTNDSNVPRVALMIPAPISTTSVLVMRSTTLGHLDEARFSRVHHGVEPVASFEALVELLHRALGKRSDIEVLAYAAGPHGCRQHRGASLNAPGQEHLRGRLSVALSHRDDQRVVEQSRFQRMAQRGE